MKGGGEHVGFEAGGPEFEGIVMAAVEGVGDAEEGGEFPDSVAMGGKVDTQRLRDEGEVGRFGLFQGQHHFLVGFLEAGFLEGGGGGGVLVGYHEAKLGEVVGFGPGGGVGEEVLGDALAAVGGFDGHVLDEGVFGEGVDGDFFVDGDEDHADDGGGGRDGGVGGEEGEGGCGGSGSFWGEGGIAGDADEHAGVVEAAGEPAEVAVAQAGFALPAEGPVVFVLFFDLHAEVDDGGEVGGDGVGVLDGHGFSAIQKREDEARSGEEHEDARGVSGEKSGDWGY